MDIDLESPRDTLIDLRQCSSTAVQVVLSADPDSIAAKVSANKYFQSALLEGRNNFLDFARSS